MEVLEQGSKVISRDDEEPNFPEKVTQIELITWQRARVGDHSFEPIRPHNLAKPLCINAEQHQQGLSYSMKRMRRKNQHKPNLAMKFNSRLPKYLQEVETFNPELMIHVDTETHCTIPDITTIADEERTTKMVQQKPWGLGVIRCENESLVDENFDKRIGEEAIKRRREITMQQSSAVAVGVLQQWQTSNFGTGRVLRSPVPILKQTQNTRSSLTSPRPGSSQLDKIHENEELSDTSLRHASR